MEPQKLGGVTLYSLRFFFTHWRICKTLSCVGGFAAASSALLRAGMLVLLGLHQYWLFVGDAHLGVCLTLWCCDQVPDRNTLREGKIHSWVQSPIAGFVVLGPVVRQSITC